MSLNKDKYINNHVVKKNVNVNYHVTESNLLYLKAEMIIQLIDVSQARYSQRRPTICIKL